MKIINEENMLTTAKSSAIWKVEIPKIIPLSPSTAYVAGSKSTNVFNQDGNVFIGKSAPERKNIGNMRKLPTN